MRLSLVFRRTALILLLLFVYHTTLVPVAGAALIGTDSLVAAQQVEESRARIAAALARAEVAAALQQHGVTVDEVRDRVAALTDREAVELSRSIDALPAAGDGFGSLIGALVFIFLVLLFTDIIGVTDVYPFVKKR